jgi:hypothetical protein
MVTPSKGKVNAVPIYRLDRYRRDVAKRFGNGQHEGKDLGWYPVYTSPAAMNLRPIVPGSTVMVESEAEAAPLSAATGRTIGREELSSIPSQGLRWQDQNAVLMDGADATQSCNSIPAGGCCRVHAR